MFDTLDAIDKMSDDSQNLCRNMDHLDALSSDLTLLRPMIATMRRMKTTMFDMAQHHGRPSDANGLHPEERDRDGSGLRLVQEDDRSTAARGLRQP